MSPPAGAGVVNVGVWLWTDARQFVRHSVTAWVPTPAGNVWSTTTATPVNLVFASGEPGAAPVVCAGPGTPWTDGEADDAVSDCMFTYRHSSSIAPAGAFATTMSIVWHVNWAASDGTSGELPDLVTATGAQVTINVIQALVND